MAIIGALSEFPLPEVLLIIGRRSGRLRLYGIPNLTLAELEIICGSVHALNVDGETSADSKRIVDLLIPVAQSIEGMFEFQTENLEPHDGIQPLALEQLVISLVVAVDESAARQVASATEGLAYILTKPMPDLWIDPALEAFFAKSKIHLEKGIRPGELAQILGLRQEAVHLHLHNLYEAGFVKMVPEDGLDGSCLETQSQLAADIMELNQRTRKLLENWPRPV